MSPARRVRRAVLTCAGFAVAAVFLAPYLVMLLDAAKPAAELRATPPRLLPVRWQLGNFVDVLRTIRLLCAVQWRRDA